MVAKSAADTPFADEHGGSVAHTQSTQRTRPSTPTTNNQQPTHHKPQSTTLPKQNTPQQTHSKGTTCAGSCSSPKRKPTLQLPRRPLHSLMNTAVQWRTHNQHNAHAPPPQPQTNNIPHTINHNQPPSPNKTHHNKLTAKVQRVQGRVLLQSASQRCSSRGAHFVV